MLVTNSLKMDLNNTKNAFIVGLALVALGNICSAGGWLSHLVWRIRHPSSSSTMTCMPHHAQHSSNTSSAAGPYPSRPDTAQEATPNLDRMTEPAPHHNAFPAPFTHKRTRVTFTPPRDGPRSGP